MTWRLSRLRWPRSAPSAIAAMRRTYRSTNSSRDAVGRSTTIPTAASGVPLPASTGEASARLLDGVEHGEEATESGVEDQPGAYARQFKLSAGIRERRGPGRCSSAP